MSTTPPEGPLPSGAAAVPLDVEGIWFVDLTNETRAALGLDGGDRRVGDGFLRLSVGVERWARELSADGDVMYVYSEFFGGCGTHDVIAWRDGEILFGPWLTSTEDDGPPHVWVDPENMAINHGLRTLGVQATDKVDEFAQVGLDRY
ncbi:hypothetical protein KZ829_06570 [Actinoplanes hulinensis]|uniref:Uncharacterized protein n=1 Tax=Actinoplanes hulinensis TaxID=1144547 RepID=A0ABS7AXB2_9ACTN|nr:hypothetical protein [Actinoplanes hulinensis]MBW6433406.1 hypothetical protein [Actinoplanes hulinensis]